MAACTSVGTMSPRYIMHTAMYLPLRGSHLLICARYGHVSKGRDGK